jgi:hypothetical protein
VRNFHLTKSIVNVEILAPHLSKRRIDHEVNLFDGIWKTNPRLCMAFIIREIVRECNSATEDVASCSEKLTSGFTVSTESAVFIGNRHFISTF